MLLLVLVARWPVLHINLLQTRNCHHSTAEKYQQYDYL